MPQQMFSTTHIDSRLCDVIKLFRSI